MNIEKLKQLAISDSGFVFDPATGYSYNINNTAKDIIKLLIDGHSVPDITKEIEKEYDSDLNQIEHDIHYFLNLLKTHQLINE